MKIIAIIAISWNGCVANIEVLLDVMMYETITIKKRKERTRREEKRRTG
jgi:hypothetical protein